jgi:AAA domain-containing protein
MHRRLEPAHSMLHDPLSLAAPPATDVELLLNKVKSYFPHDLYPRQEQAFAEAFSRRMFLLWGPAGTGKTLLLATIILGWLERCETEKKALSICLGSSNYNAIDKLLTDTLDLIAKRKQKQGGFTMPLRFARLRSDSALPSTLSQVEDIKTWSEEGKLLARDLGKPQGLLIVGGTWQQLTHLAEAATRSKSSVKKYIASAKWFDLLVIDEASQVEVAAAAAYFLLLKEDACAMFAGDHRQLGPVYGFEAPEPENGLFDCAFTYLLETHNLPKSSLNVNFRSNDEITGFPRLKFYEEGYEAHQPKKRLNYPQLATDDYPPQGWPESLPWVDEYARILDPELPIAVITYDLPTYTVSNPFESQIAVSLTCLFRLMVLKQDGKQSEDLFWKQRLGIVTPHRAQMSNIRNRLLDVTGIDVGSSPFVDTVDRFQGLERDLIIASYTVADRDFVRAEESFILSPRRFNVTLTRAESKFILLVSQGLLDHLPADLKIAREAAALQLFVDQYCSSDVMPIILPFIDEEQIISVPCRLHTHVRKSRN